MHRETSPLDARKLVLMPTELALKAAAEINPETGKIFEGIKDRFGSEKNELLLDMLQELCEANAPNRE